MERKTACIKNGSESENMLSWKLYVNINFKHSLYSVLYTIKLALLYLLDLFLVAVFLLLFPILGRFWRFPRLGFCLRWYWLHSKWNRRTVQLHGAVWTAAQPQGVWGTNGAVQSVPKLAEAHACSAGVRCDEVARPAGGQQQAFEDEGGPLHTLHSSGLLVWNAVRHRTVPVDQDQHYYSLRFRSIWGIFRSSQHRNRVRNHSVKSHANHAHY